MKILKIVNTVFFGFMILILLGMMIIFPLPGIHDFHMSSPLSDNDGDGTVVIEQKHLDLMERKYTEEVENAFCLFGKTNETHYIIEEVKFIENPIHQEKNGMTYICKSEVKDELPNLLTDPNYKFIGNVHTHPRSKYLSSRDIWFMGLTFPFQRLWGIGYQDEVNFFNHKNLQNNLDLEVK